MSFDFLASKEFLSYDSTSGVFTWTKNKGRIVAGAVAGHKAKRAGYYYIKFNQQIMAVHRLAWYFVYGHPPECHIDHINGDKADNRIVNLRDVDRLYNAQNLKKAHCRNTCGLLGVTSRRGGSRYDSSIWRDGKSYYLGSFITAQDAHNAYLAAKRELHEGCTI